jgi:uncharacterized protein
MSEPTKKPVPLPDSLSLPYWAAAKEGRLEVQRCGFCGFHQFPPDLLCRRCQSTQLSFTPVSGHGRLYSYAVYTRSFSEAFPAPYVLALVDLVETPEVRLMTNVVETPLEDLFLDMDLEVTFEPRGAVSLPQFRAPTVRS